MTRGLTFLGMKIAVGAVLLLLVCRWSWASGNPDSALAEGSASPEALMRGRIVYDTNCAVCHGINGDGAGMAAHMFRVQPRDFRRGLFKFRSTPSGSLPTDGDLRETVTAGLRWTGMVGRADLTEGDRWAVIQYLKTLSPRFTAERPAQPIAVPPAPVESAVLRELGGRLYRDADCAKCHGERGRGDGPSAAGLKDDWGWPTWPSDLTWRPLKRGSSPEGIYLTIATGLAGTPMPSYGDALGGQEIWALVSYLETLVPPEHRLSPMRALGEEPRGWMAIRMGRMMGPGMRGGMMGGMRPGPMMR
jgi:cytochrome c oxidase cbb3-type subunit I/II